MIERLKGLRKLKNLTQKEFGEKIGITGATISAIEQGKRTLTERNIVFICERFNINEEWLRYGTGDMFSDNHLNLTIDLIRKLCIDKKLRWTNHIFIRLTQRNISMADVEYALLTGEIIEEYPSDYPYPSCLVLGVNIQGSYIHVVCGSNGEELWLITAYYPSTELWSNDFKVRKENKK